MIDARKSALLILDSSWTADPAALLTGLHSGGLEAVTAPPNEAARVAGIARPDVVVLACDARAEAACALCRDLTDAEPLRGVPLVVVGLHATVEIALKAFECGAVDVVRWPEQEEELPARLQAHVGVHGAWAHARDLAEAMRGVLFDASFEVDRKGHVAALDAGTIELFTEAARRANGDSAATLADLLPNALVAPLMNAIERAADAGRCQLAPCRIGEGGGARWLELSVTRRGPSETSKHFIVLARDVTERRLAEENRVALEHTQRREEKMASISRLSRGVSNDMRNVLGAILSFATSVREDIDDASVCRDVLERITEACWRGADLASELATLSGETHLDKSRVSVNETVREVIDLLSQTVPAGTEVITELCAGDADILGVPTQISQVMTYLALHAVDSMKAGGVLTVKTEERNLTASELEEQPELGPGSYVILTVSDTGEGMDPAAAAHAFEPFYVVKSSDEGSGLELPMVYGVVRSHRGELTLESELGRGTTVSIFLPAYDAAARRRRQESPKPRALTIDGGKILIIDDEELIRESCSRLLHRLGHEVLLASTGAEALELFRERREEISLVILDLVMPGLSGAETLDKLLTLDADAQVLISSGHAGEHAVEDLLARGAIGFLPKPFGLEGLRQGLAMASSGRDQD